LSVQSADRDFDVATYYAISHKTVTYFF